MPANLESDDAELRGDWAGRVRRLEDRARRADREWERLIRALAPLADLRAEMEKTFASVEDIRAALTEIRIGLTTKREKEDCVAIRHRFERRLDVLDRRRRTAQLLADVARALALALGAALAALAASKLWS